MVKETTTADRTLATEQTDSMTKVHVSEDYKPNYVVGVRDPITVRIDRGVYKRYKPVAKRLFGSTCKGVETHMITVIEVAERGVYFSSTERRINIEKIVIERNLGRERRNFRVPCDLKPEAVDIGKCVVCGKIAYVKAIGSDGVRLLCKPDFQKAKPSLLGWKVLESVVHG